MRGPGGRVIVVVGVICCRDVAFKGITVPYYYYYHCYY